MSRLADIIDVYRIQGKIAIVTQFQYRMANFLWFLGMITEPVIYLIVWQTVAESQGGEVGGYTTNAFAGYYIVWTLVRYFNIGMAPNTWSWRVQRGQLSHMLLRPVHPYHTDLADFLGWKVPYTIFWLPAGALLVWIFKPVFDPELWQVAAFAVSLLTGFIMRFTILWAFGMITFWVTRFDAIFQMYVTLELLLSGRMVPLSLMPEWAANIAQWLPFQWAFSFPIELALGRLTVEQTIQGFIYQAVWFLISALLIKVLWTQGIKKYTAVGN